MEQLAAFKKLLSQYVAFKSISTDKVFVGDINKTVKWLTDLLKGSGFKVEQLKTPGANPIVFGIYNKLPNAKTILIYGHYDVQPAAKNDGWSSEPFGISEKSGRLIGRGVVDNKGQNLIHIFTVLNLIKEKKLKYNIKFFLEGDEETGSTQMEKILKRDKNKLKANMVLVSDGEILGDRPSIEASLRGGCNVTLSFRSGKNDLHSGLYGGGVPNAAYELTKFLARLFDGKNKVTIPGFYDKVDPITSKQVKNNKGISPVSEILKIAGVKKLLPEEGIDFYTQVGLRPTLQITGFKSGYIGEGYSNIVPAVAEARINFRFVKSQDVKGVMAAFEKYLKSSVPNYITYSVSTHGLHNPVKLSVESKESKEIQELLTKAYGKTPVVKYVGGAIGFVTSIKETLGVDVVLASMGNDDCNMHGVNENFKVDLIKKGLAFSRSFFAK